MYLRALITFFKKANLEIIGGVNSLTPSILRLSFLCAFILLGAAANQTLAQDAPPRKDTIYIHNSVKILVFGESSGNGAGGGGRLYIITMCQAARGFTSLPTVITSCSSPLWAEAAVRITSFSILTLTATIGQVPSARPIKTHTSFASRVNYSIHRITSIVVMAAPSVPSQIDFRTPANDSRLYEKISDNGMSAARHPSVRCPFWNVRIAERERFLIPFSRENAHQVSFRPDNRTLIPGGGALSQ